MRDRNRARDLCQTLNATRGSLTITRRRLLCTLPITIFAGFIRRCG
ncbi:MAG: hypothetical protein JO182_03640 [Acidobacteriaceae bacterium]|nr:hypothetical protein [Acidobacteriaceae bacterium]MBV9676614.1 hypothetical protein [Acidobacteriaceae bacterium]